MWNVVRTKAHVADLREVNRRYGRVLERYSDARDRLEHLDERLPGKAKATEMQLPQQPNVWALGYWDLDGTYGIGGEKWDVTPASVQPLRDILTAAEQAIRKEGRIVMDRQRAEMIARHKVVWERDKTCKLCGGGIAHWEAAIPMQAAESSDDRIAHGECLSRSAR